MRRALLAVLLVSGVTAGWFVVGALSEELPPSHRVADLLEREDATLDMRSDDPVLGTQAPFDCRRADGDESLDGLVDDVDFTCTPRKNTGEACEPGECAGLAVDVEDGRITDYEQFGGG